MNFIWEIIFESLAVTTQRPVPGTRRTRATASLRRPVPAPGALIAGRLVAGAGDDDVYEVGASTSSRSSIIVFSDIYIFSLFT